MKDYVFVLPCQNVAFFCTCMCFTNQKRFINSVASIGVVLDICSRDPSIIHETHLKQTAIDHLC